MSRRVAVSALGATLWAGCLVENPDWGPSADATGGSTAAASSSSSATATTNGSTGASSSGPTTSSDGDPTAAAGTSTGEPTCADLDDGTECDDGDVCTAVSLCMGGQCVPLSGAAPCTVADSTIDFAETQGTGSWFYGYWDEDLDSDVEYDATTDFIEMVFADGSWTPAEYPELSYIYMAWWGTHPKSSPRLTPIRRWVSTVSGPATLRIHHYNTDTAGDGTIGSLRIDSFEKWRATSSGEPIEATVDVELEVGTIVDLLVLAGPTEAGDTTQSELRVESRP